MSTFITRKYLSENFQKIFLISIGLGLLAVLLNQYVLYASVVPFILLLIIIFGEPFILGFIIITLFTLVGDVSGSLRIYIQLIDFLLLGILFLKRYGLEFSQYPRIPGSITIFLFIYYLAMISSAALSRYPSASAPLIIQQTIFFIVLYLFYSLIRNEKDVLFFLIAIVISSLILTTSSIISFINSGFIFANLNASVGRISGLIANVNAITNFYIISLPLVIISFFINGKYFNKKLSFTLLIYFIAGILVTISRTAVLGVLLSTSFLLLILRRKYFYFILGVLIILVSFIFIYQPLNEFLALLLRVEEGMSNRDYLWTLSTNIISDHPVFGIGAGSYKYEMFNYFPVMINSWPGQVIINISELTSGANISHNFFLRSYTDLGILGLVSALLIPVIYFRIGIKTIRYYKNGNKKTYYVILALFISGSTMFLRSFVDDIGILTYGWIAADLPFWLIFSCLVFYYNNSSGSKTANMIKTI